MKLIVILANNEQLRVTRSWVDRFRDGFSTTVYHQGVKLLRVQNRWIVRTETDTGEMREVTPMESSRKKSGVV